MYCQQKLSRIATQNNNTMLTGHQGRSSPHRASAEVAMQSCVLATVELSVCPSVTHRHCVKTTQARIMKSSRMDSPRLQFVQQKVCPEIRKGSPGVRVLSESG